MIVLLKTIASERFLCWMVQKELIRTVDLGPFKHIVDDGLELRKGAFECMDTLLDSCLDQIDPSYFITPFLLSGLSGVFHKSPVLELGENFVHHIESFFHISGVLAV